MSFINASRVKETSTTTGTGTYSLAGAATGFRTFVSGVGTGNYCDYTATDGTDWECGIGLVTDASPDTLARTSIIASTNAGAAVNWGAGTRDVFVSESGLTRSTQFLGRKRLSGAGGAGGSVGPIIFPHGITYIQGFLYWTTNATNTVPRILLGGSSIDTGTNYSFGIEEPNVSPVTGTSQVGISLIPAQNQPPGACVFDVFKPTASTVARVTWLIHYGSTAASSAPQHYKGAGIWVNTTDLIQRVQVTAYGSVTGTGTGEFAAETNLIVYGSFEPEFN